MGMTNVKLSSKMGPEAIAGIAGLADMFYDDMSTRAFAIVELAVVGRTEPAPDNEKDEPSVTLKLAGMEVATYDQSLAVRKALYAMRAARTSTGTLTEGSDTLAVENAIRAL